MSESSTPPMRILRRFSMEWLVRTACVASLVSMALMTWSIFDPTPFPVMVSMTVGQAIGTLALVSYLAAVLVAQLRRERPVPASDVESPPKAP